MQEKHNYAINSDGQKQNEAALLPAGYGEH
jgi:hypothetical protein